MRSDNHTHQWGACRRPVISAREKEGNHLPLLFRELHTAGNRGFIRAMQEYGMALYPQRITDVAGGNGGAFTYIRAAPCCNLTIPMFANDKGMNATAVYP